MDELAEASDVYIRSLASRKTSDGLADNLPEMLDAMDDFEFAEVILETVGVGQAEYAARVQVDTLVLVLLPDSGDAVQAMKAGIMELADIFVVNKSDLSGANKMAAEIKRIEAIGRHAAGTWAAPVLLTASSQPESIQALSDAIDRHQKWLLCGEGYRSVVDERARYRLRRLLERRASKVIAQQSGAFFDVSLDRQVVATLELIARLRDEELRG
jgi:LAO/AO transport system kinase